MATFKKASAVVPEFYGVVIHMSYQEASFLKTIMYSIANTPDYATGWYKGLMMCGVQTGECLFDTDDDDVRISDDFLNPHSEEDDSQF